MSGAKAHKKSDANPIILVIDGIRKNIEVAGGILGKAGFEVMAAASGPEAWEQVRTRLPDLILLNFTMPDESGVEVCRELQSDPRTNKIPIILLTDSKETEDLARAFQVGAVDFVAKPFGAVELLARVGTHLELKRAREALRDYSERLRELNDEKNEFLGIAAHDLRSPLSNIVTSSGMVLSDPQMKRPQVDEFMGIIQASAAHMIHLVENLMDVNAIEQGRLKIEIAPTELGELLRGVANSYQGRAIAKKQCLQVIEVGSPLVAMADPHSMIQVLDNLVSNAIKYSPSGKKIDVRLVRVNGIIRCEVEDEGPGLTKDDLSKVFGKFARLSAKPTGGESSTGLGLSIVKRMVEAGGGKVWCESEAGRGAKFIVELPAAPAEVGF